MPSSTRYSEIDWFLRPAFRNRQDPKRFAAQKWLRTATVATAMVATVLGGCRSLTNRDAADEKESVRELLDAPTPPELIRQAVAPRGLNPIRVSGVGLANALPGTGGPADPSPFRDQLIEEMRRNDVENPNEMLELTSNAIVRVSGLIPPAAKRGDVIDLTIDSPPGSNATDLSGGWLLDTRLRLERVIQGRLRRGDVLAVGTGPLLIRSAFQGDNDERLKTQAVVLGGASIQKERTMGLVIRPEYKHVKVAAKIAAAINRRYFFFDGTTRRGVAKPVEDDYVELELHPRYEHALGRYIGVLNSIVIDPREAQSHERLERLSEELSDPETAADAAMQLEALGESAVPTLIAGTKSDNEELRFYAAEALAYLDRGEAVAVLEDAIANESAFRHPAFAALKDLDHAAVIGSLVRLFDQPSLETRYGAFVTLRERNDGSQVLAAEEIGKSLRLYELESTADPAIVVSTRQVPEVVLFGTPSPLEIERFLIGPAGLIVKPEPNSQTAGAAGKLRISRFQVGQDDRRAVVGATVPELIRGIVQVGGNYSDVVAVLRAAKAEGYLKDQVAIDPLPKPLRTYYRDDSAE